MWVVCSHLEKESVFCHKKKIYLVTASFPYLFVLFSENEVLILNLHREVLLSMNLKVSNIIYLLRKKYLVLIRGFFYAIVFGRVFLTIMLVRTLLPSVHHHNTSREKENYFAATMFFFYNCGVRAACTHLDSIRTNYL